MDKMDGMTMNIEQANVEKLKEVFPEVFADGKVDFDKLQGLLGHYIADDKEKYSFSWKGKADSLRLAQKRSTGTLRPCIEESKDWDTTENLYIEGDNLEVLKLLQSSYLNSIKMIYIDPPYNSGSDFVYTDDFADGIAHYKEVTGQTTKSNPETAGRYHTNWLNMMYPRLKLARNLLTDDGVIFISIDENEMVNLGKICNEIFGETNFVECLVYDKKAAAKGVPPKNMVVGVHEYIYCYAKNKNLFSFIGIKRSRDGFSNPDNDPRGLWRNTNIKSTTSDKKFIITDPQTGNQYCDTWAFSELELNKMISEGRIIFPNNINGQVRAKEYYNEFSNINTPIKSSLGLYDAQWNTEMVSELMGGKFLQNPKHLKLMKYLVNATINSTEIVLDFFSGSATTAHAVMQLNAEDGGHRKFICVQLPEKTDEQSEAYKAGYKTICEIGKERIRRAGEKIKEENKDKEGIENLDIGFKVFKLDSSNLVKWDNTPTTDEEEVKKRIQQSLFYLVEGREDLDLVYEIMLKYGLSLTLPVEERKFDGVCAYIINHPDYKVLICLQPNITLSAVEEMDKETIGTYIFADRCFADANILSNTEEILKKKDKEMRLF